MKSFDGSLYVTLYGPDNESTEQERIGGAE